MANKVVPDKKQPKENAEKANKKRKKVEVQGNPAEAYDASDPLGSVIFFGRRFTEDEREDLLRADMSLTLTQVSQLSLRFLDVGFRNLEKGIYAPNIPVAYEDLRLDVATVALSSESGQRALDVRCRPRAVRMLKKRTGSRVLKNLSPSEFVQRECKAIGVKCVVQPSPKRKQVARDNKRDKKDTAPPSSWTTFNRLAAELGYVMFEQANIIYFAKPSWLKQQNERNALSVEWGSDDDSTAPLTVPRCTRTEDTSDDGVTISVDLPSEYGRQFRPGGVMEFSGVPTFEGKFLISSVNFSLLNNDSVTVVAGTPVDPKGKKDNDSGRTSSLRFLLEKRAGFKGKALDIAIGVAMAQSGGDATKVNKEGINTKWGAYTGLFQIRALNQPEDYEGLDKRRKQGQLKGAEYNADFVFDLTKKGTDWSMFSTFTDGSYKKFSAKKGYEVTGWSAKLPKPVKKDDASKPGGNPAGESTGTVAGGRGSASLFVSYALRQTGDAYVYGAVASGPDPSAFDCSELVQWASAMAGASFPGTSASMLAAVRRISVDQAIRTKGALLFHPGHVAISLGNGRTIEAANPGFGVGQLNAAGRFTAGGLIPNMRY